MPVIGIIAEFNPFHNGHLYLLDQIKQKFKQATIVVAMSGNFLERGEPACVDKWTRAKQACLAGIDLVVELPVSYCIQPADRFALGAVKLLKELDVDYLCFGAEHADYDFADLARQVLDVHGNFQKFNESYAAAYQRAVTEKVGHSIDQPNDLLGLAYARACLQTKSLIKPVAIQRLGAEHHDQVLKPGQKIASATAIRKAWKNSDQRVAAYLPAFCWQLLQDCLPLSWDDFWPLLRYQILASTPEQLRANYDLAEGLEYRLKQQLERLPLTADFEEWLKAVKTKRYTYTHLSRVAATVLLQLSHQEVFNQFARPYLRPLAFNLRGQKLLHKVKKQTELPIIAKVGQEEVKKILPVDYKAGKIYELACKKPQDLKRHPLILKPVK